MRSVWLSVRRGIVRPHDGPLDESFSVPFIIASTLFALTLSALAIFLSV